MELLGKYVESQSRTLLRPSLAILFKSIFKSKNTFFFFFFKKELIRGYPRFILGKTIN